MDPADKYLKGMRAKFGYFATWLPNEHVEVGDIGILKGSLFGRLTNLRQRGIEFKVRTGTSPTDIEHISSATITVSASAAGAAPGGAAPGIAPSAGLAISFSGREAFAFKATECYVDNLEDQGEVERMIIERFQGADWLKEWHVVTRRVRASTGTILVSHSDQAKLELSSENSLQGLGDIGVKGAARISREEGSITKILGGRGLTPLFMLGVLKSKLLTGALSLSAVSLTPMDSITPRAAASDKKVLDSLYFEDVLLSDEGKQTEGG